MLVFRFLAIVAAASAEGTKNCEQKNGLTMFQTEDPVEGNCEEKGLGWKGRNQTTFPDKDEFFTKWTDFFLKPDCIHKIEVHIHDVENSKMILVDTITDFREIHAPEQNPSNTVMITHQPAKEICQLKPFKSKIKFFNQNGDLPCFEVTRQDMKLSPEHPLESHFINNKGPIMERAKDNSGMNIFWRKGMMDTCVQDVEWTVDGSNTTTVAKEEEVIFI